LPEAFRRSREVQPQVDRGLSVISENNGASRKAHAAQTVLCIPALDEADELVALMLAQVLEQDGNRAQSTAVGTQAEILGEIAKARPDCVCISALSPFAVSHARSLYAKVRAQFADLRIVVGLWAYPGDLESASHRLGISRADGPFTLLSQVRQF